MKLVKQHLFTPPGKEQVHWPGGWGLIWAPSVSASLLYDSWLHLIYVFIPIAGRQVLSWRADQRVVLSLIHFPSAPWRSSRHKWHQWFGSSMLCSAQSILACGAGPWQEFTAGWHLGEWTLFIFLKNSLFVYSTFYAQWIKASENLQVSEIIEEEFTFWYFPVLIYWEFINLTSKLRAGAEIGSVSIVGTSHQ